MVLVAPLFVACSPPPEPVVANPAWSAGPLAAQFSFVVIADPHLTTAEGDRPERLTRVVEWVNREASARGLRFVLILGDVAWAEGFPSARGALDALSIPWIPINGDNEVQFGADGRFDETFVDQYAVLAETFSGWEMAPTQLHDPEADRDSWFHSFAFDYGGVRFVGLDWASRHLGGPESELGVLHDHEGGTLPFLERQLVGAEGRRAESIVLFSHIPMHLGGFDLHGAAALAEAIAPVGDRVWANLAGHYHFSGEERLAEGGYDVVVTDAVWDDEVEVRVVSAAANEETFSWRTDLVVVE